MRTLVCGLPHTVKDGTPARWSLDRSPGLTCSDSSSSPRRCPDGAPARADEGAIFRPWNCGRISPATTRRSPARTQGGHTPTPLVHPHHVLRIA